MRHRIADRLNHEYWPWWVIYLPVIPFYLYQAIRQRRAAFFTNVNPSIDLGGFFGERKSSIYQLLPEGSYPRTVLVRAGSSAATIMRLREEADLSFPLIVKPDIGERGRAVRIARDERDLIEHIATCQEDMLMQQLAEAPLEFSLFFMKHPDTTRVELLSITGKRFLSVEGDGMRAIEDLLNATVRGGRQARRLSRSAGPELQRIAAAGERILVEPIGNHCRGTAFFDASQLATPELRTALQVLLTVTSGIHYGRFDVRCENEAALQAGRFTVIELNGVSSEPGHIYDPERSVWWCWQELLRHVRRIGALSERLQHMGHEPASAMTVVRRCMQHFATKPCAMAPTPASAGVHRAPNPAAPGLSHGTAAAGLVAIASPAP
ncbi:MAG: hypothetical protein IPL52_15520 [Flavobacteriales bacterium]|nr:hypothetical protein [Flavobacteriales bacterium]